MWRGCGRGVVRKDGEADCSGEGADDMTMSSPPTAGGGGC
jgi:hypothetical protein